MKINPQGMQLWTKIDPELFLAYFSPFFDGCVMSKV